MAIHSLRPFLSALLAAGAVLAWCGTAQAQFGSGGGGQGTTTSSVFGNRTVGGGSGTLGGSNFGGNTGRSGAGTTGLGGGGSSMALPGTEVTGFQNGPQQALQVIERASFVGADSSSAANLQSLMGAQETAAMTNAVTQQLRTLITQQGRQNDFNTQQQRVNQGARNQPQIRVPLRLGFESPPVSATQFTSRLEQRFTRIPGLQTIGPIQVEMVGRTAILRGTVASQADRELAANLARLEPEVSAVQNELVVASAASAEVLPAATPAQ